MAPLRLRTHRSARRAARRGPAARSLVAGLEGRQLALGTRVTTSVWAVVPDLPTAMPIRWEAAFFQPSQDRSVSP
jgi:hypothetical protein